MTRTHMRMRMRFPLRGWLGLGLVAVCWPLNWGLEGMRTAYLFFPLWLGYILVVDALAAVRTGTSPWHRSRRDFVLLFLVSAPAWWLFEVINWRTRNWEYLGSEAFSRLEYFALCSISFSTVMPAVFASAELVRSFPFIGRFAVGRRIPRSHRVGRAMALAGVIALALVLAWPRYFYPLVWLSVFLLLEPLNLWLGRPTLLDDLQHGDWRPVVSLSLGALLCGFFWELWNYYSWPKWIYHTPGAQFLHVFEMPLLGFGGYLPFAWELSALRNLVWPRGLTRQVPGASGARSLP